MVRGAGPLAVVLVFLSACVSLPGTKPQRVARANAWLEIATPHFVLHTDLDEARARARAAEFESTYLAVADLAFHAATPPLDPIEVVLFAQQADFASVREQGWVGGYMTSVDSDERPRLVLPAGVHHEDRHVFTHELTHRFVHYFMPGAPRFLDEGMATFYETMDIGSHEAVIGESVFRFKAGSSTKYVVGTDDLLSASALLALPPASFAIADEQAVHHIYASSWMFVSFLVAGPVEQRDRFARYVRALGVGEPARTAWSESFAGDPLDDALAAYAKAARPGELHVPYSRASVDATAFAVRALSEGEQHILWATLSGVRSERASVEIKRALAASPTSAEAHYWAGKIAIAHGDAAGIDELERAHALAPDDARYTLGVAEAHLERASTRSELQQLAPEVNALADKGTSKSALLLVAAYFTATGDAPRAIPFAQRAVALDPSCWSCLDILAQITEASGDVDAALTIEQRALAAYPHGTPPRRLLEHLAALTSSAHDKQP